MKTILVNLLFITTILISLLPGKSSAADPAVSPNTTSGSNKAGIDEISSIPFKSIVKGMMHPGVWRSDSVPLKMDDFMSSMLKMPDISSMRYLGENVAVISREYVNLTLRFGYHFNMMDCYCSENIRDNHIYFRFVGGATDIAKRSRRAELLAQILKE